MDADFPAAHSMDTMWYAVDRNGHVAAFWSSEAGAVPGAVGDVEPSLRQLAPFWPEQEVIQDLAGRFFENGKLPGAGRHCGSVDRAGAVLLFLKSLAPVRKEIAAGRAVPLSGQGGEAVFFSQLGQKLFRKLHDEGQCLGCIWTYRCPATAERLGLFRYRHLMRWENWTAGPYGRQLCPSRPLHIDQLPPDARRGLLQVRFEGLSFAETPHLQPMELTECNLYQDDWVAMDGTRRTRSGDILGDELDEETDEEPA
jgi:hypothetical protein